MTIIPYSINRKETWDEFVARAKNGTFLLQRNFMDYHADRFFDCSLLVYDGITPGDEYKETSLGVKDLVAVFPANWDEARRTVHSHEGLTYGGLLVLPEATQGDVMRAMRAVLLYYLDYLQAERVVCKPVPYIYSAYPSGEELYALFRAGARLSRRLVSTVIDLRHPMRMRSLRLRQARKALDHGCYIDRMTEGDTRALADYWALLEHVLDKYHGARPVHTLEEMALLMERFPRHIKLYLVRCEGRVLAGTVVFESGQVAHAQYIASGEEGRSCGALDLLLRHLVSERYRQMAYFDLGTSNEEDGRVLNEGLVFQKEGFGGRAVCYDTYEVPLDRPRLASMCGAPEPEPERVRYLDLKRVNALFEPELGEEVARVARGGWYLLGEENERFARSWAAYTGAAHCVPVASGLDALTLTLMAWRETLGWAEGDEVVVPSNTYIATILAVSRAGLRPVLCEPRLSDYLMNPALVEGLLTERTRALLPVHLYGRVCDTDALMALAAERGLRVLDDAAQAHGAARGGRRVGSLCHATAFSFYPGKNLGALGDAGCVTTDDGELASVVRSMANYGSGRKYEFRYKGLNSRMDELQAAALCLKMRRLDEMNELRRAIARVYDEAIDNPLVVKPAPPADPAECVYHVYPVRCPARDALRSFLASRGVETVTHYPVPPHRQLAYREWAELTFRLSERIHAEELSLPMSPVMTEREALFVARAVNAFVADV